MTEIDAKALGADGAVRTASAFPPTPTTVARRPFRASPKLPLSLVGFAAFLLAWHLAVEVWRLPRFAKLPGLVEVFVEWTSTDPMYGVSLFTAEYYQHILVSLKRIVAAFSAATLLGVPLGLLLGWSQRFREYVFPVFETLRPVPILAWVPISIILFSGAETSVVFLTFIAAFFVTTLNTMTGVQSIDPSVVRAARCLGASPRQIFRHIVAPGALPHIFTGLQVSMGVSWFSLVAAEMVSGEFGLGYLINTAYAKIQYPTIAIGMITLGAVGYASSALVRLVGARLMAWRLREIGVGR
ncbi:ABC transporter permease [Hansschlegelia zhihuaiae]|uniref:ABC transporter permease n=1 Tax=Hansschlegelia zhihuaiae TaxID=405005 RepID=A0A4Q0MHD7_9HYPH|nr:ABC transporter permease [Hansschlegelia zhihuaiae]RXF72795.1 ABC transporter permease [Hansschlegelia zhihuaiae]